MNSVTSLQTFNRPDRFAAGWHWALACKDLLPKQVMAVSLLGRDLAVWRSAGGNVVAMDAYCPHMGAHLAEGSVEGESLRCFFHRWKFSKSGHCTDVPCLPNPPTAAAKTWETAEHLGLIWIWTGAGAAQHACLPFAPELQDQACDIRLGRRFEKNCHPNVVLINAIDEQHFNSVHNLPVSLRMKSTAISASAQAFSNITKLPKDNLLTRFVGGFYKGPLTYSMCYHFGSSGTVTLGPDFLHFYILFALRLLEDGRTEGQTVLLTPKRTTAMGAAMGSLILRATEIVGNYFAKGDTKVFQTMHFNLRTPTKADHAIINFVQHCEQQPAQSWGSWQPVEHRLARVGGVSL